MLDLFEKREILRNQLICDELYAKECENVRIFNESPSFISANIQVTWHINLASNKENTQFHIIFSIICHGISLNIHHVNARCRAVNVNVGVLISFKTHLLISLSLSLSVCLSFSASFSSHLDHRSLLMAK